MTTEDQVVAEVIDDQEFSPDWGENAPKGGRTVLNRVLKDGAKVPLFLGQTLVRSLAHTHQPIQTTAKLLNDASIPHRVERSRMDPGVERNLSPQYAMVLVKNTLGTVEARRIRVSRHG